MTATAGFDLSHRRPHHAGVQHPGHSRPEHTPDLAGDGQIQLDRRSRTLLVDGAPVVLTKREFELLAHLAHHRSMAMSRPS